MLNAWRFLVRFAALVLFTSIGLIKLGLGVVEIMAGYPSFSPVWCWVLILTGLVWIALGVYTYGFEHRRRTASLP